VRKEFFVSIAETVEIGDKIALSKAHSKKLRTVLIRSLTSLVLYPIFRKQLSPLVYGSTEESVPEYACTASARASCASGCANAAG
jgi:hypothetical protein